MDLCLVVVTILISVPASPNAPGRHHHAMPHHLIILDTDVVFPLPNSRLYHNQRNANIPVSSATTSMCSSSWSMKDLIKPLMWQPCLHVHCFLPTAFALYTCIYMSHFHCWWQCWSASICCGSFHDCIHVGRLVSLDSLIVWHIAAAPLLTHFDRSFGPSEVSMPNVSEVLCQSWPTLFFYCFSLPSTMTTTGCLFFSFQLPGLCDSGAYVFSSDNHKVRNSRRELEEVASAWITEVYRGRANRGRHLAGSLLRN